MVTTINDSAFESDVIACDLPVLVEFGAAWCPPCRALAPVLEAIADDRATDLRVVTIDVDANPITQARYGVMSLPTLLLFMRGKVVRQSIGFLPHGRLLAFVDDVLATAA